MYKNLMKLVIVFLIISTTMFANDLITNYRLNGLNNIEKQLDMELTKKSYWNSYLKNIDTTFGFTEKYTSLLACNKSKSTLTLYQKDANNTLKLKKVYSAFVGKEKGDKIKEGDLKTPIGIYELTQKISKVDSFYGPLAFVTSYPNEFDKYKGKDGHGIWIHGLPTEQARDEYTKGCIAINNDSLECLDRNINLDNTVLIINQEDVEKNISKDLLASILAELFTWRYAWLYNDITTYINFYLPEFIRSDKMDYNRFVLYKNRIFKKNESKKIIFKNISVYPYPYYEKTYQITFKEYYEAASFEFVGDKTLIVKLDDNNNMHILTEK